MTSRHDHYDALIIGAGIAGSALAQGLSNQSTKSRPIRVLLLERSLAEPDRIVGELLQPGGVRALKALGIEGCLEGMDAIPAKGYCVVDSGQGRSVHIPYPGGEEGRSFHHGRFIMNLRAAAAKAPGVDVVEATVTDLIEDDSGRVTGVKATKKAATLDDEAQASARASSSANGHANGSAAPGSEKHTYLADVTIIADGCFSNFRSSILGKAVASHIASTKSHFVGAVLENATLPIPKHGTVALVKGYGPVLLYQISQNDTRMLVNVRTPLPSDLKKHILDNVMPQLPPQLHDPIRVALDKDRLRRMPNTFFPPVPQSSLSTSLNPFASNPPPGKRGAILIGDAWNMRHPLTGGGMTVALNDAVLLSRYIGQVLQSSPDALRNWDVVEHDILKPWWWERKGLAATINILSVALYDLFGAEDVLLEILRTGCFKYFELGGQCVSGPVSLLAGIAPSTLLLFNHFFAVAFYSIWLLFTTKSYWWLRIWEWPFLAITSVRVFWKACVVFGPLLWTEVRWWAPSPDRLRVRGLELILLTALAAASFGFVLRDGYGAPSLLRYIDWIRT
ncbi:SE-domain-containing protein [Pluteus cervinus]|uniref:SE-domain-containing protein n=1 Tax=Pluteus cervinus TaxID=181527 RepID=A0ACD3A926_9AGAR|nr:SE-domain-containing protein [Pluteus cervinus]